MITLLIGLALITFTWAFACKRHGGFTTVTFPIWVSTAVIGGILVYKGIMEVFIM